MANFNEVELLGVMHSDPKLRYDKPENDPARKLVQVSFNMIVVRGIRHFGAINGRVKLDMPVVMTRNPQLMEVIAKWHARDIIEVRGTLASLNLTAVSKCPSCGQMEKVPETIFYINPIGIKREKENLAPLEANNYIRQHSEFSNRITVAGKVTSELNRHVVASTGQRIVNYKLQIRRKYHDKNDKEENRYDFLTVKSYGSLADSDMIALKRGSEVLIGGMLQVRRYEEPWKCPSCGSEYKRIRTATEIIPYSTEYIRDGMTLAEVQEVKDQQVLQKAKEIESEYFDNRG